MSSYVFDSNLARHEQRDSDVDPSSFSWSGRPVNSALKQKGIKLIGVEGLLKSQYIQNTLHTFYSKKTCFSVLSAFSLCLLL